MHLLVVAEPPRSPHTHRSRTQRLSTIAAASTLTRVIVPFIAGRPTFVTRTMPRSTRPRAWSREISATNSLTGGDLELFLDRDALRWGDDWRERIAEALAAATFFIPIMTPRYFDSAECRREVIRFAREASRLGVESLVLPVLYAPVSDLVAEEPSDEALLLLKPYQYEDWTTLRFEELTSGHYRRAVARLAQRLADTVRAVSAAPSGPAQDVHPSGEEPEDEPGYLELIAEGEDAMPRWQRIVEGLGPALERLAAIAQEGTEANKASDARGGGAAGRLRAATRIAAQMRGPTDQILQLGEANTREVARVDGAVTALLDAFEEQPPTDPTELREALHFFDTTQEMVSAAARGAAALDELSAALTRTARMASVLRPTARDLQKGLRGFVDAQVIYDEWDRRISEIRRRLGSDQSS